MITISLSIEGKITFSRAASKRFVNTVIIDNQEKADDDKPPKLCRICGTYNEYSIRTCSGCDVRLK